LLEQDVTFIRNDKTFNIANQRRVMNNTTIWFLEDLRDMIEGLDMVENTMKEHGFYWNHILIHVFEVCEGA
jgi:hypothetical protein